jgi:flagellar hook-associated protein 2
VSTSSVSNLLPFTGISQYAADFQAVLTKTLQIAQIPVTLLQSKDSAVIQKENALGSLSSSVADLATSLQSLGALSAGNALGVTSSDPTVVTATTSGATTATTYTINSVTTVATAASERSSSSFLNSSLTPVSSVGRLKLIAGSFSQEFNLTTNTLIGVRDQINSLGAGVTASILTTSGGNYLSITANSTGATNLQLVDDPQGTPANILTSTNQGSNAEFHLNGIDVKQAGNVVNSVIPGLTFTVLAQSATPVTLSVKTDPTQLSSALQDFVAKYNTLQSAIFAQVGPNGGPLTGDSVISQLQSTLRHLAAQTSTTGTVHSFADLGISFSSSGQASFNSTVFSSLSTTQVADGFKYLGSATTGVGGFSTQLSQYSDPIEGLIQMETAGLRQTDLHMQTQIDTLNTRISAMQAHLTFQLEAADALQAQLQAQQQEVQAGLQAVSLVLYGRNQTQF